MSAGTAAAPAWTGGFVPLQETEVIQAIRLLTRFGQVQDNPNAHQDDLQKELVEADPNTRLNLQQLLGSLAAKATENQHEDTPLLMKAAEHMAIRFALDRYQKGEVKVNAVHQMMEHMSRQMDTLRQILRVQEDKMSKANILVESHADILDRMFWAEVPEAGKKSVLLSGEAACVPPRNIRKSRGGSHLHYCPNRCHPQCVCPGLYPQPEHSGEVHPAVRNETQADGRPVPNNMEGATGGSTQDRRYRLSAGRCGQ